MTVVKFRVPDHVHGTWQGREMFGCSCQQCKDAWEIRRTYFATQIAIDKAYESVMAETRFADILDKAIRCYRLGRT